MRCHSGEAASPPRVTPASAAWMLAGSISTNSRARQTPAARRVAGSTSPTAPASSSTPVR
ncbi:hypothetical protein ACFQZ3_05890 [Thermocatellispora tengchongensis]|uniref:hypothetical protein n=1 Tax=Thermocatellispora tengchongensis TaxID=1073253 RepID=UPI0035E45FEA